MNFLYLLVYFVVFNQNTFSFIIIYYTVNSNTRNVKIVLLFEYLKIGDNSNIFVNFFIKVNTI